MTRVLALSDIHSNEVALDAVLEDADKLGPIDITLCLGDIVGYGPNPNECVRKIRDRPPRVIVIDGNHDAAVTKNLVDGFNNKAVFAVLYNQQVLERDVKEYILSLSN